MYNNIPLELRRLRQWICWRYEDGTKVPYDVKTGRTASTTDPSTWADFTDVVNGQNQYYSGIGFVFTKNDPYTGIDLDNSFSSPEQTELHKRIFDSFNSYTEKSPSGKGFHIIIKGNVPTGRRRSGVEVYSDGRFFTFTGAIVNGAHICDRQEFLIQLWQEMGGAVNNVVVYDQPQVMSDNEVIELITSAANSQKACNLANNEWQGDYPSHSEADFAFINMITYSTKNPDQIKRIFLSTPLGSRPKSNRRDYVDHMINRSFDRTLPMMDFNINKEQISLMIEHQKSKLPAVVGVPTEQPREFDYELPPGLMGELASYIYASSVRPVKEIALMAAIGLMAGICGRAFNISNTGLNFYLLLLARTGRGKEGMRSGIDKIMNAIIHKGKPVPAAGLFIGPGAISSGPALRKSFKDSNCFVSIFGEFGYNLLAMAADQPFAADVSFQQQLLTIYMLSGKTCTLQAAKYSDKDNNADAVKSPSFSILAESTPSIFFQALNEKLILGGLVPRFIIMQYDGIRVPMNENHDKVQIPDKLLDNMQALCALCLQAARGADDQRTTVDVGYTDEADAAQKQFNKECDFNMNNTKSAVKEELWNRVHLNTVKLAALIAVGVNMFSPIVTLANFLMAKDIIVNSTTGLSDRFDNGLTETSDSENQQVAKIREVIKDYLTREVKFATSHNSTAELHKASVIPKAYFIARLRPLSVFRKDRRGATRALNECLAELVRMDVIRKVPINDMIIRHRGSRAEAYQLIDLSVLSEN